MCLSGAQWSVLSGAQWSVLSGAQWGVFECFWSVFDEVFGKYRQHCLECVTYLLYRN